MEVSAGMAAWVDYPDEEIPELSGDTLLKSLQQAQGLLSHLLAGYDNGQLMTAGVDTVIVGRPNVGKSALMNDLTGQETSIVTAVQGTTRDVVERMVRLGDLTLRLADTAGCAKRTMWWSRSAWNEHRPGCNKRGWCWRCLTAARP